MEFFFFFLAEQPHDFFTLSSIQDNDNSNLSNNSDISNLPSISQGNTGNAIYNIVMWSFYSIMKI
jgi:hypothetical protein